jgi:hypothetical protein
VWNRSQRGDLKRKHLRMDRWTSTALAKTTPDGLLDVLTHPQRIRLWSPVDFELDDLDTRRLVAGSMARVTGKVAGVRVSFQVEVHRADAAGLELSADGPIGLDVRYDLAEAGKCAEVTASVQVRRGRGMTGRVVAGAAASLLSAGALDGAVGRIAQVAEAA